MTSDCPANSLRRRAFTLLEVLLVLMLIGISAATIVPHLNGALGRWQLRETARNLQTTLQLASQWSSARQEAVVFSLNTQRGNFSLRFSKEGDVTSGDLLPTGRQSFGQGVGIAHAKGFEDRGTEKVLLFRPDGSSDEATIVLIGSGSGVNRDSSWEISIDSGGAVRCLERTVDETEE
jgi:type II secretion system protein H